MISFKAILFSILFLVLSIGFTDFFVKFENRCEMTYMYQVPQYVPIPLGTSLRRAFPNYKLYAYGEGEYAESLRLNDFSGNPVLFVPGNGGSYKQTRSLASVSLVMSYTSRSSLFNYFSIDYNEELSAFIGEKLELQTKFLSHSIRKIIDLYKHVPQTKIILIGHSIGGILIKALFCKPYFKPYLERIVVVFTLATPHIAPAIPFDMKILDYYFTTNKLFDQNRDKNLRHINFVSIGGSTNDKLIRSDLIPVSTDYKFDRSILTTAINDVWASADHLCIVWCRQLMIKLNQIIFDLVQDNQTLIALPERRQAIIDYHLTKRYFRGPFPDFEFPNLIVYSRSNLTDWIEQTDRLVRIKINKLIKPANHLIPLNERETIVLHIVGDLKLDTLSVCTAVRDERPVVCSGDGVNLHAHLRLAPSESKLDHHVAHVDSSTFTRQGYSHLVVSLKPSSDSEYSILIDRFTTFIRQKSISLPSLWTGSYHGGLLKPTVIFTKLISQEQSFFNLTLENFESIWSTYYIRVHTKSCYQTISPLLGYGHLLLEQQELNEYFWPFAPNKASSFHFLLKLNQAQKRSPNVKPSLLLYVEPNCGYELYAQFSLVNSSAQLVKHYFVLLVPIIVATALLVLSVQLCNLLLLYSFSSDDLDKLKTINFNKDLPESKLSSKKYLVYMSASKVMLSWRYFFYCFAQIIFFTISATFLIKKLFPSHDLSDIHVLSPFSIAGLCGTLFLLAYSLVFIFTTTVHFLADNFSFGVIYLYQRMQLLPFCLSYIEHVVNLRWNLIAACIAGTLLTLSFIFFFQSVFFLVHAFFTILMLVRLIEVNHLEMKIGRTTATSFVRAIYPMVYALQFALAVMQIPQSLDSYHSLQKGSDHQLSFGQLFQQALPLSHSSLQAAVCIGLYLLVHLKPIDLQCRLSSITDRRGPKCFNVTLILLAFCNILIGALAFEFINYSLLVTLVTIAAAAWHLHAQIRTKVELKID